MMLVERGLLEIYDPVSAFIPEFADMTVLFFFSFFLGFGFNFVTSHVASHLLLTLASMFAGC